jgi:hypothetical protein
MSDSLLSQQDIDAMLKEYGGSAPPPPPKRKPAPPPPLASPAATAPASTQAAAPPAAAPVVDAVSAAKLQAIDDRLSRLESMVEKLSQAAPNPNEANDGLTLNMVARRVQELSSEMKNMTGKLQATLGFDIFHTFNCDKCRSKGTVSLLFRCTTCGHQSWRGWYPKRRR